MVVIAVLERNAWGTSENGGNHKRGRIMKSKTLAFVILLIVTAFLLMQAIAPHAALADASWTNISGSVSSYSIQSLAYDSVHNLLYAGTFGNGVWVCTTPSTTPNWTDTGGGVSTFDIEALAYDSTHNVLYAGTEMGVWQYHGTTWTNTVGGVSNDIWSLAYDSVHNLLYAGTVGNGVWKYDGTTWTNTGGGDSIAYTYSLAYDSAHNLLYAGTIGDGVWKYDGTTWTNTGGGVSSALIYSLAYDSAHNLLYAGTFGDGVWKYDGTTWTSTGGGDSIVKTYSLAYDSVRNLLYAGTGSGVCACVNPDTTPTWTDTAGEVSSEEIKCLAYDSNRNVLYAGLYSSGVYEYNSSVLTPPPIISSIVPKTGLVGTSVHVTDLTGTNFRAGATVKLSKSGQGDIKATGVTVSSSRITCDFDLTGAAAGTWDVVVINPGAQEGRLPGGFTVYSSPAPTISSISPSYGASGLAVNVTITGSYFQTGASVQLAGGVWANATNVSVVSDKQITCQLTLTFLSHSGGIYIGLPLGKYDVVVRTPDGQEGRLTQGFSVTNICGQGAGSIVVAFGFMIGLLSLAGTGLVRRRIKRAR